ncbi:glucose-6-phosphate dehydrogenase [Candidatus Microgenomates bacterium]|nr:MAG: glucose-6-phosphate dehydrogenase [Candidatus Microgenomates bacterium]
MMTPFIMVIFGASGHLALSKLLPALFNLFEKKQFPKDFFIIGFARRPLTNEEFRDMFKEDIEKEKLELWNEFSKHLYYQQGMFDQKEGYNNLFNKLKEFDNLSQAPIPRFFYLATPPVNYPEILDNLETTKLAQAKGNGKLARVIIEKPFGKDLETAKALDKRLSEIFEEKQIFRVDHYLGKETVQNMIAFRFANGIFEPVWNKKYIDHVQISWSETRGVGSRGKFIDGVGILRDVAQNHLMQLIAAVAMESPKSFSKEGVRDARADAIKAIRDISPRDVDEMVVRGQYDWYREEKDVAKNSNTETFIALKLFVDTPRFENVPFYLRAGKKMPKDTVEISIVFIQTCHLLFKEFGCPEIGNVLTIKIQPDEGIGLRIIAKKPGAKLKLGTVNMNFSYQEGFEERSADAYERLLLDIFTGDQMLFNRSDELESSWGFITKVLKGWGKEKPDFPNYKPGSWGPIEANKLIEKDGRKWIS